MSERIMVIVAHPDDEVLLAGGTIARHVSEGSEVRVLILADGVSSRDDVKVGAFNARLAMASNASDVLGCNGEVVGLPDNKLDTVPLLTIIKHIEKRIDEFRPEIVYTHWHGDMNIDHRIVSDAVKVACRPQPGCSVQAVLMGEVPSSTEWAGGFNPNAFIDISDNLDKKMEALDCYGEEMRDRFHPRSPGAIRNLASMRGYSVGVRYAEAFEVERVVL